jgi:hypothetical protein
MSGNHNHAMDHTIGHAAKHVRDHLFEDLPRLNKKKNPAIAALLGFFFNGLGLGLYFGSWKDGVYPVLVLVMGVLVFGTWIPFIGVVPGWIFAAIFAAGWGIRRAEECNKNVTNSHLALPEKCQ